MSSTFEVPVVEVKLRPHPNADTLSIVDVFGWQVVVKTEEWKDGHLAAYIRPDSVVPDTPAWAWLGGKRRIKTRRFRKEWSQGLLCWPPAGSKVGDNVAAQLQIVAYEPPSRVREGASSRYRPSWWQRTLSLIRELRTRPRGKFPYYDVEHLRRYTDLIKPGDLVYITEKIHGANALYTYRKPWLGRARIFRRSRTVWKGRNGSDWWQTALENTPALRQFLERFPGLTVYGEVYGLGVQDLTYGAPDAYVVAFDIWENGYWWPVEEAFAAFQNWRVPHVPILYCGLFSPDLLALANQDSYLSGRWGLPQMSEGIVVRKQGREKVQLKVVSDRYMETV